MVVRVSDKNQNYNNVTKLLVKPFIIKFYNNFKLALQSIDLLQLLLSLHF